MTHDADHVLLERWATGDDRAGDQLLARAFPVLYRFFVNKAGADTEDLVQKTLLACVTRRDRLAKMSNFRAYLFTMARNCLYDHLRAQGRRGGGFPDLGVSSVIDLGSRLSRVVARNEEQARLIEAARRLPVELQVAVELHYWEDLSMSEVAEVLELPVGTVKTRIRRARQLLAEQMEGAGAPTDLDQSMRAARSELAPGVLRADQST